MTKNKKCSYVSKIQLKNGRENNLVVGSCFLKGPGTGSNARNFFLFYCFVYFDLGFHNPDPRSLAHGKNSR